MLKPRKSVPELEVPLLDGSTWKLSEQKPSLFTMLVFYRGLHCPVCRKSLKQLNDLTESYNELGVEHVVISSDTKERAQEMVSAAGLTNIKMAYDLKIDEGRKWGLFVSSSRGKTSLGIEEPAEFTEPGLFFVRPDMTLYASSIQTMPFARTNFAELIPSLKFIKDNNYPARGEL